MTETKPAANEKTPHPPFPFQRVLIGTVGTALEWYDFGVYGFFAAIIGRQFFPSEDNISSLVAAFGAFAAGFLARPFGAVLFGRLADQKGRGFALTASVLLMAIPTFCISILPTHAMIGPLAGVLLVLCRILQGLSVGGEHTTSIVYLVEHAGPGHRGLAGSFAPFGASAGILLGSAVGTVLQLILTQDQLDSWGWRLPQAVGLLLALVGLWIRTHHREAEAPDPAGKGPTLWQTIHQEKGKIATVFCLNVVSAIGFYLIFVYLATYLQEIGEADGAGALEINTISMLLLLGLIPIFGLLADKVGSILLMWISTLGLLLLAWPLFALMHSKSWGMDLAAEIAFVFLLTPFMASSPSALCMMLPHRSRCTVLSIGFNLAMGLIGGTTPLLVEYMRKRTHEDMIPAYYLMAGAIVTAIALCFYRTDSEARGELPSGPPSKPV